MTDKFKSLVREAMLDLLGDKKFWSAWDEVLKEELENKSSAMVYQKDGIIQVEISFSDGEVWKTVPAIWGRDVEAIKKALDNHVPIKDETL